jgi:hypothetical protein
VGVDRTKPGTCTCGTDCPQARGGGPQEIAERDASFDIVPMHVGVDRGRTG